MNSTLYLQILISQEFPVHGTLQEQTNLCIFTTQTPLLWQLRHRQSS